ncbi:uncharacterized protein LOC129594780 [Paramacrobiotus metropolitanus]|uniref:uncharacterized protein LOC129594780 n=1 Tax=Paramacrobiotus metropolitanus TaxID=2943436 RepID=UPI0024457EB8|nr:uncharacterized protein LOC129594780 [Paramacrobiotus metropolitanus]
MLARPSLSYSQLLACCFGIQLFVGLDLSTLISIALHDYSLLHYTIFPYSIPMDLAVILLAFATATLGFYTLRSKSRHEIILESLSLCNAVLASIVVLLLVHKLVEMISYSLNMDAFGPDHSWKFWAWWTFILLSVLVLQAATVAGIRGIRSYREEHELVSSWNTGETFAREMTVLKLYSAIEIILGIVLLLVDFAGGVMGPIGGAQIYWYASIIVFVIGGLVTFSGVWGVVLSRRSVVVKRQFDAITTISYAVIALTTLVFALFAITTAVLTALFANQVHFKEFWHFFTVTGCAKLLTLVVIFVMSIRTSQLTSERAQSFLAELDYTLADTVNTTSEKQRNIMWA